MEFFNGAVSLGTATLVTSVGSTTASLSTSALPPGSLPLTAIYQGDNNFKGSSSAVLIQTIRDTTSTALASSLNPSTFGQSVTFTAMVTSSSGTPTGVVTFLDGGTTLGTGTLAGGVATLTTSTLSAGDHALSAMYEGDANFASSTTASVLTQTVDPPMISISALPASATLILAGETVSFLLTIVQEGTLPSDVGLSCSGLPAGAACAFDPTTVAAGSSPATVALTVTTSRTLANMGVAPEPGSPWWLLHWVVVFLSLTWALVVIVRKQAGFQRRFRPVVALATLLLLLSACGGGGIKAQQAPRGVFPIVITGTAGSVTGSTSFIIAIR